MLAYEPTAHGVHWLLPDAMAKEPRSHGVHSAAPSCDAYEPGSHSVQVGLPMGVTVTMVDDVGPVEFVVLDENSAEDELVTDTVTMLLLSA
jgi:hypothetical protein